MHFWKYSPWIFPLPVSGKPYLTKVGYIFSYLRAY
jgi:hypothetical protein